MGAVIPGAKGRDRRFLRETFLAFEEGIKIMWPGFARPVWRRRHLVFEPSFGVIQKPGLVGMYRPHWRAPNVDGLYFASVRAVLGLSPFSAGPPIWTAAHGPRMLELTGRKADGWLPTKMTPGQYQASLKTIGAAAREAGRDPGAITPAMLGYVLLGPDEETVQRLTEQPLVRALCVLLPAAVFRELGVEPPLAAGGRGAYPRMLAGYAEHEDTPVRRVKDGSTVVVEVSFTGRTTAGRPVVFDAVDVFDLAGPRIRRLSTWYDTAAVRRQVDGG